MYLNEAFSWWKLRGSRFPGEVEQISLMKPKAEGPNDSGLLEYLEDIIGSNKYIEEIEAKTAQWEDLNRLKNDQ